MARRKRFANTMSSTLATLATLALLVGVLLSPNVVVADDTPTPQPCMEQTASDSEPNCYIAVCTSPTCTGCFAPPGGGCSNGCTAATCVDAASNQCGCGTPPGILTCSCT